jgi:hypothetical protein
LWDGRSSIGSTNLALLVGDGIDSAQPYVSLASINAVAKVAEGVDNMLVSAISVFIDNACAGLNAGKVSTKTA